MNVIYNIYYKNFYALVGSTLSLKPNFQYTSLFLYRVPGKDGLMGHAVPLRVNVLAKVDFILMTLACRAEKLRTNLISFGLL